MRPRIRNERGQFIRQLKPWSMENFNEGFIARIPKGNRFKVYLPNHPRANKMGHVLRQLAVYEAVHGIDVKPPYLVHHIDGDTLNDSPENLEMKTVSEHKKEHLRRRGKEAKIVIRICEGCGKRFELKAHRLKDKTSNRGRFCSQKCYHNYNRGENNSRYIRTLTLCEYCGKPFKHLPSYKRRFCNRACSANYFWKKRRNREE